MELVMLAISSALISNVVLSNFLGICPFLGVSNKVETAKGMGLAVIFVICLATAVTYGINAVFLKPTGIFGKNGIIIIPEDFRIAIFVLAPGAFFVLACLTAIQNKLKLPSATNTQKKFSCDGNCSTCNIHKKDEVKEDK